MIYINVEMPHVESFIIPTLPSTIIVKNHTMGTFLITRCTMESYSRVLPKTEEGLG
jgi:hypothetical protein